MLLLLLAAIHPLLHWFFTNLFLCTCTCMQCTESLIGETSLSLIRKTYAFSCICCALPRCYACLCTALCFHSQHKNTGLHWLELPSYIDFYIYFGMIWASICKDRNQTCHSSHKPHYVWMVTLSIIGGLGFHSSDSHCTSKERSVSPGDERKIWKG